MTASLISAKKGKFTRGFAHDHAYQEIDKKN